MNGRNKGPIISKATRERPRITHALVKYAKCGVHRLEPDGCFTSIEVVKNANHQPHRDKGNIGKAYIIALGNFTGAELAVEEDVLDVKDRWHAFDGSEDYHFTMPKRDDGTRYSLIAHTPKCYSCLDSKALDELATMGFPLPHRKGRLEREREAWWKWGQAHGDNATSQEKIDALSGDCHHGKRRRMIREQA